MKQNQVQKGMVDEIIRCREYIENALAYSGDTHNFDDVMLGILLGNFQFWPTDNSCMVTEIINYPRKKVFHVFLAGGSLNEIKAFHKPATEWAKAQGCSAMTLTGRPGWEKALASEGWEYQFTTLKREI
jgi:hypothetical protein|tara:strand:+ start:230 stop:616 length:387 start_codon:yes stop_codon:yes gene_type:complete